MTTTLTITLNRGLNPLPLSNLQIAQVLNSLAASLASRPEFTFTQDNYAGESLMLDQVGVDQGVTADWSVEVKA